MSKKTILVTGCSAGGIGAAIAAALASPPHDHHVFATARDPSKIPASLSSLPNVTVLPLDVCSPASISDAVKLVTESDHPTLDVLVNNAGAGYAAPVLDIDVERAQRLYNVNVWGPVRAIQAFAGLLIASRGRVVNISSCGAVVNCPWIGAYASSKSALTTLSETLRLELAPSALPPGSRYVSIEPTIAGWASGELTPKGMSADEFAASIVGDIVGTTAKAGGLVWKGVNAGSVKVLGHFAPQSIMDAAMSYGQGLKELKAHDDQKKNV
ncbi:oxidoreductase [Apiospora arundinis]